MAINANCHVISKTSYLQAYTSVRGSSPELKDNRDLAILMNNVSFHSTLVDSQEEILNEVSDLSIFWLVIYTC